MTMAVWPPSLPIDHFIGVSQQRSSDATIETPTRGGPSKERRRFTSQVTNVNETLVLTDAQKTVFDAFYETTLFEGVLPFTWTDPDDATTATFKFNTRNPPRDNVRGLQGTRLPVWNVSISLKKQG